MEDTQQAFPAGTSTSFYVEGMTLLQWYAGQAMPQAAVRARRAIDSAHTLPRPEDFGELESLTAKRAFRQAQAMIREYERLLKEEG